jgi:hypothetical protein
VVVVGVVVVVVVVVLVVVLVVVVVVVVVVVLVVVVVVVVVAVVVVVVVVVDVVVVVVVAAAVVVPITGIIVSMGQYLLRKLGCPLGHYIVCALQQTQQVYRFTEDEITETCGLAGKHITEEVILQTSTHK